MHVACNRADLQGFTLMLLQGFTVMPDPTNEHAERVARMLGLSRWVPSTSDGVLRAVGVQSWLGIHHRRTKQDGGG